MNYLSRLVNHFCGSFSSQKLQKPQVKKVKSLQKQDDRISQKHMKKTTLHSFQHISQIINHCKNLEQGQKPMPAPWIKHGDNRKILLLDLDKTLIYTNKRKEVILRPHLKQFIEKMSLLYDIYIFTAASIDYLQFIVEIMKKNNIPDELFKGFLTRQNCIKLKTQQFGTIFIKDIKILNSCSIQKIIIIDDTPISYCLNPYNALPISPFTPKYQNGINNGDNDNDDSLLQIMQKLRKISKVNDVRACIKIIIQNQNKEKQKQKQRVHHIHIQTQELSCKKYSWSSASTFDDKQNLRLRNKSQTQKQLYSSKQYKRYRNSQIQRRKL